MDKKIIYFLLVYLLVTIYATSDPEMTSTTLSDTVGNSADANSVVSFAALPTANYSVNDDAYQDTGMEWWYKFVDSFIDDIVFPKGFPTATIAGMLDGTLITELTTKYNGLSVFGEFGGYVIFLLIGFLFIFIFPLIGCCFCCCRCCCGNCGGDMMQKKTDAENTCKRRTFVVILMVLILTISLGMACMYMTNSNISLSVTKFNSSLADNLDDMGTYVDNMVTQVKQIGKTNFNFTQDVVFRDLDSIGYIIGIPVRTTLTADSGINTAMTNVLAVGDKVTTISTALTALNTAVTELQTAATTFSSEMTSLKTYITTVNTNCIGDGLCTAGTVPDMTAYDIAIDTSAFPDLSSQTTKTASVASTNFTELTETAMQDLNDIPWRVQNETVSTRTSIRSTVTDFSDKTDSFVTTVEGLQSTVKDGLVEQGKRMIDMDTYKAYDQYRYYGGLGLCGLVLLVVVTMLLALLCAVAGHKDVKPTERGCCSTCGGRCFMVSVCLVFLMSSFLMLLTMMMFMIGAPLKRFVCEPLTDTPYATQFSNLIDTTMYQMMYGNASGSYLGAMLLQNSSSDLSLSSLLQNCQSNKAAFEAMKMDSMMNISALTDFKSTLDIDSQTNNINIDLSTVSILTSDLETNLDDLKSAVNIDFTNFYAQINGGAMTGDLDTLITLLDTLANTPALSPHDVSYGTAKTWTENIKNIQLANLNTEMAETNTSVSEMETATQGVDTVVDNVKSSLNVTEQYIRNNASDVIKAQVTTYATRLVNIVEYFVNDTLDALNNELGACKPLYNIYNSLLRIALCQYLVDSLNAFWFSMGWCIFFFLPSIIFATKLAKHYKRMSRLDKADMPLPEKMPLPEEEEEEEEEIKPKDDGGLQSAQKVNSFYKTYLMRKGLNDPLSYMSKRVSKFGNNQVWHSSSPPPYSASKSSRSSTSAFTIEEKGSPW